jgi:signal transduction histidine kinase
VDDDSDGIFVQVSDTGIGIPADELPMVFDKYYRASNATSAGIPGNGLGLALVREVVDGHCGDLDVESLPEGGTTVTLWLPRHPPLQDSTPR